jgi:hypothetical protein
MQWVQNKELTAAEQFSTLTEWRDAFRKRFEFE